MEIDNQTQTHPNPQPNPHHRKIDLQSPHDLTFLQDALAKTAQQRLDLHFPKLSKPATHISLDPRPKPSTRDTKDSRGAGTVNSVDSNSKREREEEEEEEDDDPMRRRVQDLIHTFLTSTWQSASHNISVNGIEASSIPIPHTATLAPPPPSSVSNTTSLPSESRSSSQQQQAATHEIEGLHFNYAPFDPALQHKLASLHGELEALTAQVSQLRRTAPGVGAEHYRQRLAEAMEEDDRQHEEMVTHASQEEQEGEMRALEIQGVRDGWNEDVRDTYERGVGGLAALAGVGGQQGATTSYGGRGEISTLTETVGKAQRAKRVALEME